MESKNLVLKIRNVIQSPFSPFPSLLPSFLPFLPSFTHALCSPIWLYIHSICNASTFPCILPRYTPQCLFYRVTWTFGVSFRMETGCSSLPTNRAVGKMLLLSLCKGCERISELVLESVGWQESSLAACESIV